MLDEIKTKGVDNYNGIKSIAKSLSKTIINSNYISVKELTIVVETHLKIFFNKTHVAKLGQKIINLQNNVEIIKAKSKRHNIKASEEKEFWRDKYKEKATESELNLCYKQLKTIRDNAKYHNIQKA